MFAIPSGHCAGSYDGVLLSTDLEPDDALAIKALAPRLAGVPLLLVVGEGPVDKRSMGAEMLAAFGLDAHATVVQGRRSAESWPAAVTSCYHDPAREPHRAQIVASEGDAAVAAELERFLGGCAAPFALLLKPPHELLDATAALGRTVGALYGSFNLTMLREGLGPELSEAAKLERQHGLMRAFKAFLLIERSTSVGRDCAIEPTSTPGAWLVIDADAGLSRHVALWNVDILHSKSAKLARSAAEMAAALGTKGSAEAKVGAAEFDAVAAVAEKADKSLAIVRSIGRCRGRQVCHADTLVAACLVDDGGELARFGVRCKLAHDAKLKLAFEPDAASTVAALLAPAGAEREALASKSLAVLEAALASTSVAVIEAARATA